MTARFTVIGSFDDLKIILILQNEILLLMLFCKHVLKQREDMPSYNTKNNPFLGTECSNIFCENCLFKKNFKLLSTKLVGKAFFSTHLLDN